MRQEFAKHSGNVSACAANRPKEKKEKEEEKEKNDDCFRGNRLVPIKKGLAEWG